MWGKGMRLEIHNNPLQHSILVRIPSDFLRHKILDKNIWYPSLKRTCSSPVLPKIHYQSSKPPHISPFPEIGTLNYLANSPFIDPPQKKNFFCLYL
ncbi:unnamed protein product [Brassica rapa subsp. trilocularis]